MDTRYGNNYATGNLNKPMEGKMVDYDQCDSGIDSFNPSLQSFDEFRSNSYQTDLGNKFSNMTMSGNDHHMDDQKLYEGADDRYDSGFNSVSISSEYSTSIQDTALPPQSAPEHTEQKESPEVDTRYYLPDADGDTCLQLAIIHNKVDAAFDMIQYCTNPEFLNIANENQQTALHFSVLTDQLAITRCLVAYGADVTCTDRNGNTPLHLACQHGLLGQIEMLTCKLDKEEDPGLLKQTLPQDVDVRNYSGFNPLHLAVIHNQYEVVRVLIKDLDCDLNIRDGKSGRTALHHAIEGQHYQLMKLLAHHGADVNSLTYDEWSPLHFAAARGLVREADVLLQREADIYLITFDDYSVFELSEKCKNARRMTSHLREAEKKHKRRLSQQLRGAN